MTALGYVWPLAARSIAGTLRQPAAVLPSLAFPLIFLALITAGASAAANIPGFPAPSYFDFVLAGVLVQGALFGGINGGTSFAADIEGGFMRRLSLTPIPRAVLLVGHLAGGVAMALIQSLIFIAVALIFGAEIKAGPLGAVAIAVLVMGVGLAFSAVGAFIAIRTRSSETVQSSFPLFFIFLSFSSFFLPRELITVDWFRSLAAVNPSSYIIEGVRSLIITGWDAGALLAGVVALAGLTAAAIAASVAGMRTIVSRA